MPKYVYEAISDSGEILRTFEVWQSIHDPALEADPETGSKCRKIIAATGLVGLNGSGQSTKAPSAHSCGGGCRCGH